MLLVRFGSKAGRRLNRREKSKKGQTQRRTPLSQNMPIAHPREFCDRGLIWVGVERSVPHSTSSTTTLLPQTDTLLLQTAACDFNLVASNKYLKIIVRIHLSFSPHIYFLEFASAFPPPQSFRASGSKSFRARKRTKWRLHAFKKGTRERYPDTDNSSAIDECLAVGIPRFGNGIK